MPNLVGIGNSQVPTNAMLGGLAYQDPAHANLINADIANIAAIKAKLSGTAIDIFVYDTRKDSDGGAWRHRTQNTSWYNEFPSSTRGTRKEFPAVAVIVAENDTLTIYDGDDSDLPMWMVFNAGGANGNHMIGRTNETNTSTSMLNGLLCVGRDYFGLHMINFITDRARFKEAGYDTPYTLPIGSHRNGGNSWLLNPQNEGNDIMNDLVYSIAMTVLPNASIDSSTGLPIPTIVVGTAGGVSVIKDDGTVDDLTGFSPVVFVAADGNKLVGATSGATSTHDFIFKTNLPPENEQFDAQITAGSGNFYMNSNNGTTPLVRDLNMTAMSYNTLDGTVYRGGDNGFDIIAKTTTVSGTSNISLISHVDTDYNSGYMVGDIKGALLASTDDTNISADTLGSDNVLDGTFSSSDGWTVESDWSIGSGAATCNGNNSGRYLYPSTDRWDIGTSVVVQVTVDSVSAGTLSISYSTGGSTSGTEMTSAGTYYHVHEVTGNTLVYLRSDSFQGQIDDVKIYPAEADRSVNNKGIAVAGTITKTKFATNSDLVYYTGSSANNFLRQSYNADLNFGTNDFSIFVWVQVNSLSTNHYIIDRAKTQPSWGGNTGRAYFIINSSGYHRYKLEGSAEITGDKRTVKTGILNHVGFVRRSGVMEFWLNGELVQTITGSNASASFDGGQTGMTMTVNRYANGFAHNYTFDKMALLRISGSAPSAEQVEKMYDDEKLLFQENAKCTISGATSAVKALAHDDSTDTLHVGTSSGRSDFRGLNRINSTTTAVTTAISASNGLVAEQ